MKNSAYSLPRLEWVRAFEAAARLGSFTAAASETGLTQPAISQRIGQLERHLGSRLFVRQPRAVVLTVEGETWLPYVQSALGELSDSSELLFAKGRSQLTISASQSVISMWLAPRLACVQSKTGAAISVQSYIVGGQTATTDNTIQIRYGSGGWPHHYQVPLFNEVIAPVCSPDIYSENWIELPRIACTGPRPNWIDMAGRFSIPASPSPQARFDTLHGAISAAKAGCGVALASIPLCSSDLQSQKLVRVGVEHLENCETYWMLATRDAIGRRQWNALVETLVQKEE